MTGILYRAYIDSGFPILICKVTRRHLWVNASYREEACRRCPNTFRPRKDWGR